MCRWIAYSGQPIYLDDALFKPENSLIHQSLHASRALTATNGDGFGIGWYGSRGRPGLYRDVRPAWNDDNLQSVAEQIAAPLFFAHVRHSTGTATARSNCHPFRYGRWLFMHNGQIGGYDRVRRALDLLIEPAIYHLREGTTDSETFFFLMLTNGLEKDVAVAFRRSVAQVLDAMAQAGVEEPFRMTAAVSDGEQVYALRYSSDSRSPSLFYGHKAFATADGARDGSAVVVLSEPLDSDNGHWVEVPESRILVAGGGAVATSAFVPRA